MRFRVSRFTLPLILFPLVFAASASLSDSAVPGALTSPVHFSPASVQPGSSHPGEVALLSVRATVDAGWHVYSVVPSAGQGPFATTLSVSGRDVAAAGPPRESAPVSRFDPNFQTQVAYHERTATFTLPVRVASTASPGAEEATLAVRYQACNDRLCDPPLTQSLTVPLMIAAGAVRAAYASPPSAPVRPAAPVATAQAVSKRPLLEFLGFAFLAGLLTLLTPCVFPLIPVTFGYFTKEAAGRREKLIGLAAVYVGGIIGCFVLLGLIASVTQDAAGPNRIASNPWVNLGFGILFFVLAFAFFETFNLRLPAGLQNLLAGNKRQGGVVGVLLMGLAFVFTAFTCTAPFIASVLAAAASSSGAVEFGRPLLGMVVFALALSLPFFAIALFPPLLTRLPRSGAWLARMKAVLGFVELAYAVLYFSKADLVWQAHILTRPVIFGLWALIAAGGALYLLGALRVNAYPDDMGKLTSGRAAGVGIFAAVVLYCFYAISGRPIDRNLAAFVPEADYGQPGVHRASGQLAWLSDYNAAVQMAQSEHKPIFIDFTGYTCTNCRWMEQNIFTVPSVSDRLSRYVLVRLYTDGGVNAQSNQALQLRIGNAIAQPLYALLDPAGKNVGLKIGVENDPSKFAAFLDRGLDAPASPAAVAAAPAWAPFSSTAYSAAQSAGKPIVIDFTAAWCVSCHAIERQVFEDPSVKSKLSSFSTLRTDLTDFSSAPNAAIEQKFGVQQLPTIVILSPSGAEIPGTRVTGLLPVSDFLARLQRASSPT